MLCRMGVCMGAQLHEPDESNPYGYYEDVAFEAFYKKLCDAQESVANEQNGRGLDGPAILMAFEKLVIERRCLYRPWGVKHPMNSAFIGVWVDYFPGVRVILCERDENETKDSLVKKGIAAGCDENGVIVMAERRVKEWKGAVEECVDKDNILYVQYDQLLSEPRKAALEILEFTYADRLDFAASFVRSKEEVEKAKEAYAPVL